jgi:hypothetical protein
LWAVMRPRRRRRARPISRVPSGASANDDIILSAADR